MPTFQESPRPPRGSGPETKMLNILKNLQLAPDQVEEIYVSSRSTKVRKYAVHHPNAPFTVIEESARNLRPNNASSTLVEAIVSNKNCTPTIVELLEKTFSNLPRVLERIRIARSKRLNREVL